MTILNNANIKLFISKCYKHVMEKNINVALTSLQ